MTTYKVNVADIEAALASLGGLAKAKDIQDQILRMFCGGAIPGNYQSEKSFRQTIQRKIEDYCPEAVGYDRSKKDEKFHRISPGHYQLQSRSAASKVIETAAVYPDDIPPDQSVFVEGATKQVLVNQYERDRKARVECIRNWGAVCYVCGFDFEEKYGAMGRGFIHVHHLIDIASIGAEYNVDPVKDLRPVCPNCHAMLHTKRPAIDVDDMKEIFIKRAVLGE